MLKHLHTYVLFFGEKNGVIIFRKFFSWYTRGFSKIRPLREKASRIKKEEEFIKAIKDLSLLKLETKIN